REGRARDREAAVRPAHAAAFPTRPQARRRGAADPPEDEAAGRVPAARRESRRAGGADRTHDLHRGERRGGPDAGTRGDQDVTWGAAEPRRLARRTLDRR